MIIFIVTLTILIRFTGKFAIIRSLLSDDVGRQKCSIDKFWSKIPKTLWSLFLVSFISIPLYASYPSQMPVKCPSTRVNLFSLYLYFIEATFKQPLSTQL